MNTTEAYTRGVAVTDLDAQSRGRFVSKTYGHLFGAVLSFMAIEIFLFRTGMAEGIARAFLSTSWLLVLGAFMVISWVARSVAHKATSKAAQYGALAGYVVGEALIFVPLLYLADKFAPGAISS